MALTSTPSEGEIRHYRCDCCRLPVDRVWNWVHRDDFILLNDPTVHAHLRQDGNISKSAPP